MAFYVAPFKWGPFSFFTVSNLIAFACGLAAILLLTVPIIFFVQSRSDFFAGALVLGTWLTLGWVASLGLRV